MSSYKYLANYLFNILKVLYKLYYFQNLESLRAFATSVQLVLRILN